MHCVGGSTLRSLRVTTRFCVGSEVTSGAMVRSEFRGVIRQDFKSDFRNDFPTIVRLIVRTIF